MFGYGKMSGCAIAAMSALAEVHAKDETLSSQQIADGRNLSQPLVAKVLTILSQHSLVRGARGPGGGYKLVRDPKEVSLFEVVSLFETNMDPGACPFGPGWCGVGEPCPMHDSLAKMSEDISDSLKRMHFGDFALHPKHSHPGT